MSPLARFGIAAAAVLISVGVALVQLFPPAEKLFSWRASYFGTLIRELGPYIQKRAAIPVRLVAIDAESIRRSGEAWPWSEARLHALTKELQGARPRLLMIDLGGAEPARAPVNRWNDIALDHKLDGDAELIAAGWSAPAASGSWPLIVLRDGALKPSFELSTALSVRGSDRARMIANVHDLGARFERQAIRAIATEDGRDVWATGADGSVRVLPHGAPTGFRSTPAWKILAQDPDSVRGLSGSIVVVKRAEAEPKNPGWQGTQALAQLVNGQTPGRPPWAVLAEAGLAAAAALLIAVLMLARRRISALAVALLTAAGALAASLGTFALNLHLLDPVTPSLLMLPALLFGIAGSFALGPSKPREPKPASLRVVGNRIRGAERREVTALVCKIRELELVAEAFREQPDALSHVVSKLLMTASEIARAHNGTIETASASGLTALFNAPAEDARHAEHATEAALAMLARLEPLNQDFEKLFKPGTFSPFNFSIGIETGDALVGELGLKGKGELSALGPAIDTAGLLAERARTYGPAILVGAQAEARLNKSFALLQLDIVETGANERKPFYALMGNPVLRANPRFKALQMGFDAFHTAYRKGNWEQAGALLAECAKLPGANPRLISLFERRLAFLKERAADPAWNGILRVPVE